jgi:hypothetical protein
MVSFACLGHWYVQLLFAVPSLGIIGYMGRDSLRKRRAARRGGNVASARSREAVREPSGTVSG